MNDYFNRIHKNIIVIRRTTDSNNKVSYQNTNVSSTSHTQNTEILGFVAFRFRNRNVKYWLNVSIWKLSECVEVLLSYKSMSFSLRFSSESKSTTLKFCTLDSNFYSD
jgi:hypothetical protein